MKVKLFDKKVSKAIEAYKLDIKKQLKQAKRDLAKEPDEIWLENQVIRLEKELVKGSPFDLRFKKRSRVFENYKGSCGIDLINETGHSYHWWIMLKRINGKLVFNTYRYSNQTAKHINKARQVLDKLGIKYISIEAPKGLQDIDTAVKHHVYLVAKEMIAKKYARAKNKNYHERAIINLTKTLDTLKQLGGKPTGRMINEALQRVEKARADRLARLRNKIRFVIGANETDRDKVGLHAIRPNKWISYSDRSQLAQDARSKNFKTVYIHIVDNIVMFKA